ncbi:peptidase S1 [Scytonema sp. NUACC21]
MLTKVIGRGIKISLVIAGLAMVSASAMIAVAQEETPPPIFGDMMIGRKVSPDPMTVRGMSGGSVPGKQLIGKGETPTGPCTGFFDEKPDHTLELTNKFDYLKLQVESAEDTTLIISGPGGSWCNDDFEGKNPGILGEWLPGTYNIWIGSYTKDKYLPYTLRITEVK